MQALRRTWELFKESFALLSEEPSLLVFPVLTAISAVSLMAGFFVPLYRIGTFQAIAHHKGTWIDYLPLCSWYYANTFVVVFFNSALAACVNIRLSGGDPTLGDGLRIASSRLPRIAAWTLVAGTVGLLLRVVESGSEKGGRWVSAILGAGWTLITYLIVPIVIIEDLSLAASIKRSTQLLRKTWGEQVMGGLGFGLLNFLLVLPGFGLGLLVGSRNLIAGGIIAAVYLLMLAAVSSAVRGIFTVALYRFATDGQAPNGFTTQALGGEVAGAGTMRSPW